MLISLQKGGSAGKVAIVGIEELQLLGVQSFVASPTWPTAVGRLAVCRVCQGGCV